jgi:hypothetical protein
MLPLLPGLIFSLSARREIKSTESVIRLPDYGFQADGLFSFRILGTNLTGISILLIPYFTLDRVSTSALATAICLSPSSFSEGYISHFKAGPVPQWEGTVESAGIYIPVVINCHARAFTVDMSMRNPDSYLDLRESFLPYFFVILCFVNLTAVVGLVGNSIAHLEFRISAHSALAAACAVRAISHYLCSWYWTVGIATEAVALRLAYFKDMVQVVSLSALFTVNSLFAAGWGIYRERITQADWLPMMNLSWMFFVSKLMAMRESSAVWVLFALIAGVLGLFFFDQVSEWLTIPAGILQAVETYDVAAIAKLQLIMEFGKGFREVLVWGLALAIFVWVFAIWSSVAILGEELLYLGLTALDVYHFWIRRSHAGARIVGMEEGHEPEAGEAIMVEEPGKGPALVFLVRAVDVEP